MKNEIEKLQHRITQLEAELKLKEQENTTSKNELSVISGFASRLIAMQNVDEVYQALLQKISEINPDSMIILSAENKQNGSLGIRAHYGFAHSLQKIIKLLNVDPMKIGITPEEMTSREKEKFSSGKFELLDDGFYELSARRIPKPVCKSIQSLLQVEKIISMGFSYKGKPKGGVTIIEKKGSQIRSIALMESIIKHASVVLENLQAKVALNESEHRLQNIAEQMPGAVYQFCIDKEGNRSIPYISKGAEKLFERPLADLQDTAVLFNDIHKNDLPFFLAKIEESKNNLTPWHCEFRIITKNKTKWLKGNSVPRKNPDQSIVWNGILTDITARKATELKYQTLFDSANDAIFVANAKTGKIVDANKKAETLVARSRKELIGIHQTDLHPKRQYEKARYSFDQNTSEAFSTTIYKELDIIRSDGTTIPVEINPSVVEIDDEKYVFGIFRDITLQKQAEQALKESEEKFKCLFAASPDAILLADIQTGVIVDANSSAEFLFEMPVEKIIGLHQTDLHPKSEIEKAKKAFKNRPVKDERVPPPLEIEILTAKQTSKCTEIRGSIIKISNKEYVLGTFRDISERKRAEINLKQSEYQYRTLIESMQEGVWRIDKYGNTVFVNQAMENILGYTTNEMFGKHLFDFMTKDNITKAKHQLERRKSGITEQHDFEFVHKDGKQVQTLLFTTPCFDENENYDGALATVLDITKRQKVEQQLNESRKLYKLLTNMMTDFVYSGSSDENGQFATNWIVGALQEITGYTSDEIKQMPHGFVSIVLPEDLEVFYKKTSQNIKQLKPCVAEFRIKTKYGRTVWLRDNIQPVADAENHENIRLIGAVKDITEQREMELALRESEEKYRLLTNQSPDAIILHQEGIISFINPAGLKLFGAEYEHQIIGHHVMEFIPDEYKKIIQQRIKKLRETGKTGMMEQKIKKLDHTIIDVEASSTTIKINNKVFVMLISRDITARKNTERHINELTQRYKTIVNNFPNGAVFLFDKNHKYKHVAGSILEEFNLSPHDFINRTIAEAFPPEVSKIANKAIKPLFSGENCFYKVEFQKHIFANWGVPVKDQQGNIGEGLVYAIDITEMHEKEQALRESNDRFSALVNHLQSGVFYINTNGKILETNPAMLKILGTPSAELTKRINIFEFKPLVDIGYSSQLKKCIETGKMIFGEAEYTSKWEKTSIVNYYFVPIKKENKVIGVLANNRDVTEKRKIDEKLIFQSILLDNINDYITATDLEGNLTYINKVIKKTFQIPENRQKPLRLSVFGGEMQDPKKFNQIMNKLNKNEQWQGELKNELPTGETRVFDCSIQLLKDKNNKAYGTLCVSTDITQRKEYEEQLKLKNEELKAKNEEYLAVNEELDESLRKIKETTCELKIAKEKAEESNRLKIAFLNNISHEFRTPMNGISGFAELITRPNVADDKKILYATLITESCDRLSELVTDTVEISQVQSNNARCFMDKVNLNEILQEALESIRSEADKKDLQLCMDIKPPCQKIDIETDKYKFTRIIKHLLQNAVKFTQTGHIRLKCAIDNNKQLLIIVEDTGIGIAPEMQKVIFEPFFQVDSSTSRAFGGNGIGLSLVKAYTRMLEGSIHISSEINKGTSVFLSFPLLPEKNAQNKQTQNQNNSNKHNLHGKVILIVEDEEINYMFLKELLAETNAKILHAKNGKEAIELCRANAKIDLILMDIRMPEMNGYEATKMIKEFRRDIPVIAQTAYATHKDIKAIKQRGFDDFIGKPIQQTILLKLIKQHLIKQ